MRLSRILSRAGICAAVLVALCACRESTQSHGNTPPPCTSSTDSVEPDINPLIEVQPPDAGTPRSITKTIPLGCDVILSVAQNGAATAVFGSAATCQLRQDNHDSARLVSREPSNAFFSLGAGKIICTVNTSPQEIQICGGGVLLLTGVAQVIAQCDPDPVFRVAVHTGSVQVRYPNGTTLVPAGQELTFNSTTHQAALTTAQFSASDLAVFNTQALRMNINVNGNATTTQTITFTSTPPRSVYPGQMYTVSATGGSSGNPVMFSIDPKSSNVCSISGQTVTFNSPGTCTIDADQAGNTQYQAAQEAQQEVTVLQQGTQTITFTSTPAASTYTGDTYEVSATGGSSGNPVMFSIDPKSSNVCSISGQTVTFNSPGTCTIDADQAGNTQYQAAQEVQQSITVQSTLS
jgi:hypothetical protein